MKRISSIIFIMLLVSSCTTAPNGAINGSAKSKIKKEEVKRIEDYFGKQHRYNNIDSWEQLQDRFHIHQGKITEWGRMMGLNYNMVEFCQDHRVWEIIKFEVRPNPSVPSGAETVLFIKPNRKRR